MKKLLIFFSLIFLSLCDTQAEKKNAASVSTQWEWYDPLHEGNKSAVSFIQNQGWNEDGGNYNRLPLRAQGKVSDKVWSLSRESAGLSVCFKTNATDIQVRYKVTGAHSMPHMPATGISGVDLYRHIDQGFCFGSYSFGDTIYYSYHIDRGNAIGSEQEYTLYLPLYNGVKCLEIGVPQQNVLTFIPAVIRKPVVLYGTSIAQGACASRPGMAWGNIVNRWLDIPVINLGFSGNGKLEQEVLDFICEQDAAVFILDCMANMGDYSKEEIEERVKKAVHRIRSHHDAPILLVEHAGYSNGTTNRLQFDTYTRCNHAQAEAFRQLKKEGVKQIFYLSHEELALNPDSWVDYVHPSDFGMIQQAEAVRKKLRKIIR